MKLCLCGKDPCISERLLPGYRCARSFAPVIGSVIPGDHPEAICDDCGGANVVWFAPSEIWNRVCRPNGEIAADPMLCPRCFILRAEAMGLKFIWEVYPEIQQESGDVGRAIANARLDMANNTRIGVNDWITIRDAALRWERSNTPNS